MNEQNLPLTTEQLRPLTIDELKAISGGMMVAVAGCANQGCGDSMYLSTK